MKLKKIVSLTLAAGMVVSMTACGGGDKPAETTKAAESGETQAAENTDAAGGLSGELTVSVWDYDANASMAAVVNSYMEKIRMLRLK